MPTDPLAYLLTFGTYGTWLPGDERGTVDRQHNEYQTPLLPTDRQRWQDASASMQQTPYHLDGPRRVLVLRAVLGVCAYRQWLPHAIHVRTNHVHIVVTAPVAPEDALRQFKSYASRALNQAGMDTPDRQRWRRHGSTRYLWQEESVLQAIRYVLDEQGDALARYPELNAVGQNRERQRADSTNAAR